MCKRFASVIIFTTTRWTAPSNLARKPAPDETRVRQSKREQDAIRERGNYVDLKYTKVRPANTVGLTVFHYEPIRGARSRTATNPNAWFHPATGRRQPAR